MEVVLYYSWNELARDNKVALFYHGEYAEKPMIFFGIFVLFVYAVSMEKSQMMIVLGCQVSVP